VAESVTTATISARAVADTVTVSESVKVVFTPTVLRVNDRITVTENQPGPVVSMLTIYVAETIQLLEGAFNPKVILDTIVIDETPPPVTFTAGDYWVVGVQ
jgi:hypothetical protein